MSELQQSIPALRTFLQQKKQEMGGVEVEGIMISPIERLPRYRSCKVSVREGGPDYDLLTQAAQVMRSTVTHITECHKSLDLQHSLVGKQARIVESSQVSVAATENSFARVFCACSTTEILKRSLSIFFPMLWYGRLLSICFRKKG